MFTRFSPGFFSISSITFKRSYNVLTRFCAMALLLKHISMDRS
jgi:hypothetical protein